MPLSKEQVSGHPGHSPETCLLPPFPPYVRILEPPMHLKTQQMVRCVHFHEVHKYRHPFSRPVQLISFVAPWEPAGFLAGVGVQT